MEAHRQFRQTETGFAPNAASYELTPDDFNKRIYVEVTGTLVGAMPESVTKSSDPVMVLEGLINPGNVEIEGTGKKGQVLVAETGGWSHAPHEIEYQWLRDGHEIPGAIHETYEVQVADEGTTITVKATGVRYGYKDAEQFSSNYVFIEMSPEGPEEPGEPEEPPAPEITVGTVAVAGDPLVGNQLTAETDGWLPAGEVEFSYQWKRSASDGSFINIEGATGETYTLTVADFENKILVEVTAELAGAPNETELSDPVNVAAGVIEPGTVELTKAPGHNGRVLIVTLDGWEHNANELTYQWYADGKPFTNHQTDQKQYIVRPQHSGAVVTVEVTGKRYGYQDAKAVSDGVEVEYIEPTMPPPVEPPLPPVDPIPPYVAPPVPPVSVPPTPHMGLDQYSDGSGRMLDVHGYFPYELELERKIPDQPLANGPYKPNTGIIFEEITRIDGDNNIDIAVNLSRDTFDPGVNSVYIANAEDPKSALAGAAAAGGDDSPLLLVTTTEIPENVAEEIERLEPKSITVIGDEGMFSELVIDDLGKLTLGKLTQVSGPDSLFGSATISGDIFLPGLKTVYIANGDRYADALIGAAVAGKDKAPLLLTDSDELSEEVAEELKRLEPENIVVLGGDGVISDELMQEIDALGDSTVTRVGGEDRYETAAMLSENAFETDVDTVYLANGSDFENALVGAAAAGAQDAPILLIDEQGGLEDVEVELRRLKPGKIVLLGGTDLISQATHMKLSELSAD